MAIKEIKSLLKCAIVLNAATVGASTLERAVRHRMKTCCIGDIEEYRKELKKSAFEVKELIEEVVVPETWFFRNQQSFVALDNYIREEWLTKKTNNKLRVLSAPSSTGEEPYSLVMSLDKYGLTTEHFQVDAIDISDRLLIKAKRGVYGKHSFRNKENDYINAYFDRIDDTYVLHDDIRHSVNYQRGNLLEDNLGNGNTTKYDIIFCRNLLIYFDRATQEKAIENLCKLLKDDGILFLGHAETGEFIKNHLTRSKYPRAFAYHKIDPAITESKKNSKKISNTENISRQVIKKKEAVEQKPQFLETVVLNVADIDQYKDPQDNKTLREVKKLADEGKLKEASALCESYLREDPESAQAYYLLGLIRESEGKDNLVGELFQKAVYLNPNHHEALIHLALHAGRKGDSEMAKKLHQRVQRVAKRIKT